MHGREQDYWLIAWKEQECHAPLLAMDFHSTRVLHFYSLSSQQGSIVHRACKPTLYKVKFFEQGYDSTNVHMEGFAL